VPDFRSEAGRARYADDQWSPWPQGPGDGSAPVSILGTAQPTDEGIAYSKDVWARRGYHGE
jgi:hypothetical protein